MAPMELTFGEHEQGMTSGKYMTRGRLMSTHLKTIPAKGRQMPTRILTCYLLDSALDVICIEIWGNHVDRLQRVCPPLTGKCVLIKNYTVETIKNTRYYANTVMVRLKANSNTTLEEVLRVTS